MNERTLFLAAVSAAAPLVADPALAERFEAPSALAEFSVRGLAGHLSRALTVVETYLDGPEPGPESAAGAISAAAYYAQVAAAPADLSDPFHQAIRQRGLEAAPADPAEFPGRWQATTDRLAARLAAEPPGRLLRVYGDLVLSLDQYLVTRLIELAVHVDDLAVSLGVPAPPLPPAATGLVIATLVEVGRIRHGDIAVVRALTRRERDAAEALRVI